MSVLPPERQEIADPVVFRHVIGHFASGVTVITATERDRRYGMTASAVTSLSLEPPMLLVCLNSRTRTQGVVARTGRFGVNILGEDHGLLAERFAGPGGEQNDKFDGLDVSVGRSGVPILADALAWLECRVTQEVTGGSHLVYLAEVTHADAGEGTPLTYYRGRFGRFEEMHDKGAYETLRAQVLDRKVPAGTLLDPTALARELGVAAGEIQHAVARMVFEGLLTRDGRHYVVAPLDAATSDAAFDAKLALELGVLELTVGRVAPERLARFRELMMATAPYIQDGHFTDPAAYEQANSLFHGYLISLADNPVLSWLYDRLRIPEITARALSGDVRASPELVAEHRRLVDAYECGDLPAARAVVKAHSERSKETQRAGIESAGGCI